MTQDNSASIGDFRDHANSATAQEHGGLPPLGPRECHGLTLNRGTEPPRVRPPRAAFIVGDRGKFAQAFLKGCCTRCAPRPKTNWPTLELGGLGRLRSGGESRDKLYNRSPTISFRGVSGSSCVYPWHQVRPRGTGTWEGRAVRLDLLRHRNAVIWTEPFP